MKRTMLALFASIVVLAALSSIAAAKKQPKNDDAVATITQFENDAVKANLAGDASFYEKGYADDWTGGFSGGIWTTKSASVGAAARFQSFISAMKRGSPGNDRYVTTNRRGTACAVHASGSSPC